MSVNRMNVQLIVACVMCVAGLTLVFSGFWVDPTGEIHNSVLVAFGEVLTFAGALFGVDYSYRKHELGQGEERKKGGAL